MKKQDVEVGGTYVATVGKRSVEVRVERANPRGGWDATAVGTNKAIRVKAAQQLRRVAETPAAGGSRGGGEKAKAPRKAARSALTPPVTRPETPAVNQPAAATAEATGTATGAADPDVVPLTTLDRQRKVVKAMSCLDAAAEVLKAAGQPMRCKAMVAAMAARGLWTTAAPTPAATLYSAILREVAKKGAAARFAKTGRGYFALAPVAAAEPTA